MKDIKTQVQPKSSVKFLAVPLIGIVAWLIPGAGHWMLGKKNRAIAIFCGVMFLFIIGIIAGGTALINPGHAKLWYLAQIFNGLPCLIMTTKAEMGYGRGIDIGQLYTACAGLLNLMCVIDAMIPPVESDDSIAPKSQEVQV